MDVEVGVEVCAGDMVWKYVGVAEEVMGALNYGNTRSLFTKTMWNAAEMIELRSEVQVQS